MLAFILTRDLIVDRFGDEIVTKSGLYDSNEATGDRAMGASTEYRELAGEQRRLAVQAALPNVRERHERSAERWEFLAEEVERCERGRLNWPNGIARDFI